MKQITVRKRCPECSDGQMIMNGIVYTSYPPLYCHNCDKCNKMDSYRNNYPYKFTQYEPHEIEERWEA